MGQEDPLEEVMGTPVFLPGESHGQRSLVGYSPWDHRVGHDCVTEHTHTHTHRLLNNMVWLSLKLVNTSGC